MTLPLATLFDRLLAMPPVWHVLWVGLVCLSIGLVVLSRTRWGQSRPMRKCAALSLLAHVLLACLATTVKIVSSADTGEDDSTIHVALVSGEEGTADEDAAAPRVQPWEGLKSGPVSRPELPQFDRRRDELHPLPLALGEADSQERSEPQVSPAPPPTPPFDPGLSEESPVPGRDRPTEPVPVDLPEREAVQPPAQPKLPSREVARPREVEGLLEPSSLEALEQEWLAGDRSRAVVDSEPSPLLAVKESLAPETFAPLQDEPSTATPLSAVPREQPSDQKISTIASAAASGARSLTPLRSIAEGSGPTEAMLDRPSVFRHRHAHERARLVQQHGGSEETEAAVERALQWLARAQSPDGRWDAVRHGAGREMAVLGHDRQGAGVQADTGVSGLALLAFLGAGHTHREGKYQTTVDDGLAFLIRSQKRDGDLAGEATLYARMYCHAMAGFALSEAYAITGDETLRTTVEKAVAYTLSAQHAGGGWRYRPGDPGDTSQLGWQLMALRSAELAGVAVPDAAWSRADRFLQSVSRGRAGGLAAYQPITGVSRAMSAEATYCKLLLAERSGHLASLAATCDETAEYLRGERPGAGRANLYYWYYATLLLHLRQHGGPDAAEDWQTWNESLKQALLATQQTAGPLAGAWGSDTVWGGYGGRVYTTALAALCLETYYRYLPFLQGPIDRTARRPGLLHQGPFDTPTRPDRIE